jgi:hypothetical protein
MADNHSQPYHQNEYTYRVQERPLPRTWNERVNQPVKQQEGTQKNQ